MSALEIIMDYKGFKCDEYNLHVKANISFWLIIQL